MAVETDPVTALLRPVAALAGVLLSCLVVLAAPTPAAAASAPAPAVLLSPASGPAGSITTVTGTGFPPNVRATVAAGSTRVRAWTDRSGRVVRSMRVPEGLSGDVPVTVLTATRRASAPFRVVERARFGVTTPGGPTAGAELDAVAALVGEAPSVVTFYRGFAAEPVLAELDAVAARGATPLVTWEPYDWTRGTTQPEYALRTIIEGRHDPYLTRWAQALRTWDKPVLLRFAHEMNGSWYPWAEGVNGNQAGEYVRAWRHVHAIFSAAGAAKVSWVWSPNVEYPGSVPLAGLYPGDAYVDWVAMDGYNWGTAVPWSTWTPPAQLFDPTLARLRQIAPGKRVMVAETASTEVGGDKAAWTTALFAYLRARPRIDAFVWFHHDKETDWRIDSSPAAAAAFAAGLRTHP